MAKGGKGPLFLVATDGSRPADKAVAAAIEHAHRWGARIRVVTVLELQVYGLGTGALGPQVASVLPQVDATARVVLAAASRKAEKAGIQTEEVLLRAHEAASAIVRDAEKSKADLIVVGSHGRTGLPRMLLGSVAERVVRLSHCPVLVVR